MPENKNENDNLNQPCYDDMDMNKKLILNLRDLGHTIRFLYEGKGSQKQVLIILLESGTMTQRELTERMGIQPGSASEVIGKLEHAGLILRTTNPADRRTTDVQLTENGRLQAENAARQRSLRHEEMFSCLSEEEKETLLLLTKKLNTDWDNRYRAPFPKGHSPEMHRKKHGRPKPPRQHENF